MRLLFPFVSLKLKSSVDKIASVNNVCLIHSNSSDKFLKLGNDKFVR